jgi:hypothetical protein
MAVVGAVLSGACAVWMICTPIASTLPALSHDRYLIVVVMGTWIGVEYVGLARLGSDSSVV